MVAAEAAKGEVLVEADVLELEACAIFDVAGAQAERHPALSIEVDLDNRPVDLVAEGFDIGIRGAVLEDSSLVARRVARLPVVLVASPAYLQRCGVPRSVEELAQHRCIAVRYAGGSTVGWHFRRASGRRFEWVPPAAIQVSDPEALVDLALAHAGIAQAGLHHVLPYLRSGRLKLLLHEAHHSGDRARKR